ncbi:MAG TPA: class I SAM-dependent methyltransferase [Vicinamibacterales bacterium]
MTTLYTKLADLYHEMYQSIFDYHAQFRTAHAIFKARSARRVLELACGAGNLAPWFEAAGYHYTGMDAASSMLAIARREHPTTRFLRADMRRFTVRGKFDAALIVGRSFAYMTRNEDVLSTLRCIRRSLRPRGVLVFDNFDARTIFADLSHPVRDIVRVGDKTISRVSTRTASLRTGWTWNWTATYVVEERSRRRTFRDRSVLRAFTRDELTLFLTLAGFTTVRIRKRGAVLLTVAQA